jgi:hypothetical protein
MKHAPDPQCLVTTPRFTHDAWSVFATVVLGFTNGYIGTLSLLFIIDMVEPHETAYAGTLASFFLNTGTAVHCFVENFVPGRFPWCKCTELRLVSPTACT